MDSHRQKTKEELEQEEKDAALARQFQDQFDNEQAAVRNVQQPAAPTADPAGKPVMKDGIVSIACPACTFINTVTNPQTGIKYGCKQCRTPLPIPQSMLTAKSEGQANSGKIVACAGCGISNRIPAKKADAMLCGSCHRQLMTSKPAAAPAAPAPPAAENAQRTVQVRCGQCSAINAVQVSADAASVQFECGNCETVNEAAL